MFAGQGWSGQTRSTVTATGASGPSFATALELSSVDGAGLKDVALHEPDIEEVIRTFYQRRNARAQAS